MPDDLDLGPDAHANSLMAVMRAQSREGALAPDTELGTGVWLHVDPAARISGRFTSAPGQIVDLDIEVERRGAWTGLHVALGGIDLGGRSLVGFACRTSAGGMDLVRPCLRSGRDGGFHDSFFPKHLLSRPESALHLDALELAQHPELPARAPWRELVLFLPTHRLRWTLADLRLFVL